MLWTINKEWFGVGGTGGNWEEEDIFGTVLGLLFLDNTDVSTESSTYNQ